MLIWIDENRKITAWNETISETVAQEYISSSCFWVEELKIEMPEISEKQAVEMYLNEEMTIRYEIISTTDPISEQEILQAEMLLNQCNILVNQENQDTVLAEILLNQLGV